MTKELSSPFLFVAFAAFLVAIANTVASEVVDCPSSLSNIDLPFEAADHTCQAVWKDQDFILAYKKINGTTWSFVLTAPNKNVYIGIGFSETGGMVPASAVVGWMSSAGGGKALQYYLAGRQPNLVIPNDGNLTLVGDAKIISTSAPSQLYLAFQLSFEAGKQPLDKLIYALGPDNFVPGSDDKLQIHAYRTQATIDYVGAMMAPGPNMPSPMAPEGSPPPPTSAAMLNTHSFMVAIFCAVAIVMGARLS